jgi:putative ABC transport system ATP-binding protein
MSDHHKQPPAEAVSIKEIESRLPPKQPRSHHVVIKLQNVSKSFGQGVARNEVLKDVSLNFYSGEFSIVSGPSGSGKSTFLHAVLGLEPPTKGRVYLRGIELYKDLTPDERTQYRREKIGMVFQQSNWIKSLKVWENVAYPVWLSGLNEKQARERAHEVLEEVGLVDWADHQPGELSGGQQQRVSLARALATDPGIIIADEPTGNLDTHSSADIITLLARLNREHRRMVLMVTHDIHLLPIANRRVVLRDGRIVHDDHD